MGLHKTSTILIDIIAHYYNVIKCHTVKFVILNIMLHHDRRNDVKKWVWYVVWLPVPELFIKKLATVHNLV